MLRCDGQRWRSVAYQMHLSEVFVPYMDPDKGWYFRTYMDSGEYGFGNSLSPLTKGVDCPASATFLKMMVSDDHGDPLELPNAVCVFERSIGSDPHKVDTDLDGLTDGAEHALGTNVNVFDSDLDGVSDGMEVKLGTNPLVGYDDPSAPPIDPHPLELAPTAPLH